MTLGELVVLVVFVLVVNQGVIVVDLVVEFINEILEAVEASQLS